MKHILFFFSILVLAVSCRPDRDDDYSLSGTPATPDFSVEMVAGDSSRFVVKDLSDGNFQRLWSFPNGTPKTSAKAIDTVFYSKMGNYVISLNVSKTDGSGTASADKSVTVLIDAPVTCGGQIALLTGDCDPAGKCWTLSKVAGAISVGPTYDDYSWYSSPADGLVTQQYDDGFCFTFDNLIFENKNNGESIDPWQGYIPVNIDYPAGDFEYVIGGGTAGRDQIIIPDDQFIGVMDADNVLDVVKLTADELIVRTRIRAADGTPAAEGWFELTFEPK